MKEKKEPTISADALTWGDAFPVLLEDPFVDPIASSPVDLATEAQIAEVVSAVAYTVIEFATEESLSSIFPTLSESHYEISWDSLDTSSINCLAMAGATGMNIILAYSVAELKDLPDATSMTVLQIIREIARVSIDNLIFSSPHEPSTDLFTQISVNSLTPSLESGTDTKILDALRTLAEWHCLRGAPHSSLRSAEGLVGSPENVVSAWDFLSALRPDDLVDPSHFQPAYILNRLLMQLDPKAKVVARLRLFAAQPATLEHVGQELGITRERVRQILSKVIKLLNDMTTEDAKRIQELSRAIRIHVGTLSSLDRLLVDFPALEGTVELAGQPAWRVIDRLDDSFEIEDGWVAVPTVNQARALTTEAISQKSNKFGLAKLNEVAWEMGMGSIEREAEFVLWLEYIGATIHGKEVAARSLSIPDWAAIVLNSAREPLSIPEIGKRMPVVRAESSIRNALAEDERFVRSNRDAFSLAEWGVREYTGIRDLIAKEVFRSGGEISQDELVRILTGAFDVAESSVRSYSQAFPFEVQEGVVRMKSGSQEKIIDPSRVRHLFRAKSAWKLRMRINADHARGSGSVISSMLAGIMGLQEGESRKLPSDNTEQSINWTGMQPSLGSIRRFIQSGVIHEGEEAFAVFHDDGSFSMQRLDYSQNLVGLERALRLAGLPNVVTEDPRELLAHAMSITAEPSWASIISTARDRGDHDLAEALLADDSVNVNDGPFSASPASVSVNEILGLL